MKNLLSLVLLLQGFQKVSAGMGMSAGVGMCAGIGMSVGVGRAVFLNAQRAGDVLFWFLAFSTPFLKDLEWPQLLEGHCGLG